MFLDCLPPHYVTTYHDNSCPPEFINYDVPRVVDGSAKIAMTAPAGWSSTGPSLTGAVTWGTTLLGACHPRARPTVGFAHCLHFRMNTSDNCRDILLIKVVCKNCHFYAFVCHLIAKCHIQTWMYDLNATHTLTQTEPHSVQLFRQKTSKTASNLWHLWSQRRCHQQKVYVNVNQWFNNVVVFW